MPDKNILDKFSEVLTEDELELLTDYTINPDFKVLSESFEKIVKRKKSNGSQTQDNQN
ncbi:MAG: hypothetical protein MUO85_04515 [candidate division Zixibacteria bacterium]|nr:hypothetical protein [candidate division Zixibacteria bacterium]